jgi:hypothetical protein
VTGIAWEHQIRQREDQIACLRIDLFERLQAEVITVLVDTEPIELQRCLRCDVGREQGDEKNGDEGEAVHCISSARPLPRTMPGNPSFSSSETDASTFSHLQKLVVQPAGKIREPVVVSAYLIAGTALVNDVGATENQVDAWT